MCNFARTSLVAAVLALIVGLSASASMMLTTREYMVAPIWLVNALAIATLHRQPRFSPALMMIPPLVICAVNLMWGNSLTFSFVLAAINAIEIACVSETMRRRRLELSSPPDLRRFIVIALGTATVCAVAAALFLHRMVAADFLATLRTWLLADFLGLIIVVPPLVTVSWRDLMSLLGFQRLAKACTILGVTAMATSLVFGQQIYPALFVILPCLIVAAFTLTFVGVAIANGCVTVIAVAMTVNGHGPIAHSLPDMTSRMLFLQVFLAVNTVLVFPVASVLAYRKRMLERFAASDKLHRLLAENTHDMVTRIGFDGRRLYISPSCHEVLGYTPEEMLSDKPVAAIHPDDWAHVEATCRSLLQGAVDPTCTYRQRHKDGHYVWLEAIYRLVYDPMSRQPVEFVASTRDISRRRAAEQKVAAAVADLQESNRLLIMAEAAANVGHWRLDAASGTVFWSDEVYRIHGKPHTFRPHLNTALDAYHPDDADWVAQTVIASMQSGEPFRFEARIVRPDGAIRWVASAGQAEHAANGSVAGLFGVFHDISEQKEIQSQLVDARVDAERALAAKSIFTATLSHEIRTPLAGILGVVELLRDAQTEAERDRYLTSLHHSSRLLANIVDDVLVFAKLDEGKVAIEAIDFDPRALVSSVIDAFAPEAEAKGLRLICALPDALPVIAVGDPTRVQRVIANLISNAIKFTHQGDITISARAGARPEEWEFSVADTGIGISEMRLGSVFEPFVQADESITRTFGGTGLGLSICRMLVEAMSGTITVVSTIGRGSTFSFRLPLPAAETTNRLEEHGAPSISPRPFDILIAEDNATNRFLVTRIVERLGHRVTSVVNGAAAVEAVYARETPFDLILMDIQMPRLDGLAAARAIRDWSGEGSTTPIYAFTADSSTDRRETIVAAGMDGVLHKPLKVIELERLFEAIGDAAVDGTGETAAAAAAARTNEAIDPRRVVEFERSLGREARDTLLTLLIQDSARSTARINKLLAERRFDLLRLEVHSLRGAAASVGAQGLLDVLRELDASARGEGVDPAMLERLNETIADVVAAARTIIRQDEPVELSSATSIERSASTA